MINTVLSSTHTSNDLLAVMKFLVREEKVGRNECGIVTTQEYHFISTYCFAFYLSGCSSISSAGNSSSPQPLNAQDPSPSPQTPFQAIELTLLISSNLMTLKAICMLITPRCVLIIVDLSPLWCQTCGFSCLLNMTAWMSTGNSELTSPITRYCFW